MRFSRWSEKWKARECDEKTLAPIFAENERDVGVCKAPGPAQPASRMLAEGAKELGWSCPEIPKWFRHDKEYNPRAPKGERLGMSRTFLPRFARAGGKVLASCEALALEPAGSEWSVAAKTRRKPDSHSREKHFRLRRRDSDAGASASQRFSRKHRRALGAACFTRGSSPNLKTR